MSDYVIDNLIEADQAAAAALESQSVINGAQSEINDLLAEQIASMRRTLLWVSVTWLVLAIAVLVHVVAS